MEKFIADIENEINDNKDFGWRISSTKMNNFIKENCKDVNEDHLNDKDKSGPEYERYIELKNTINDMKTTREKEEEEHNKKFTSPVKYHEGYYNGGKKTRKTRLTKRKPEKLVLPKENQEKVSQKRTIKNPIAVNKFPEYLGNLFIFHLIYYSQLHLYV